jgi:hypothetical protein
MPEDTMINNEPTGVVAFVDTLPNIIRVLPNGPEIAKRFLLNDFSERLDSMIARYRSLGYLLFSAEGRFVALVGEARKLFVEGLHRGAVSLCGTAIEFICDDIIRSRLTNDGEKDRLLKLDFRNQVEILEKTNAFRSKRTRPLMHRIYNVRNRYVHPRGERVDEEEVHRVVQMVNLVVVAEFGLVPDTAGKVRPASEADVDFFAKELGLAEAIKE